MSGRGGEGGGGGAAEGGEEGEERGDELEAGAVEVAVELEGGADERRGVVESDGRRELGDPEGKIGGGGGSEGGCGGREGGEGGFGGERSR